MVGTQRSYQMCAANHDQPFGENLLSTKKEFPLYFNSIGRWEQQKIQ